jgi:hypothetical protein
MKLYLDDARSPPDESWTLVRSAEEAKVLLAAGGVEHASLDYDLGECDECKAKSTTPGLFYPFTCRHRLTGYELVKWMVDTGTWPKHKPVVHSTTPNREGRAAMVAVIERNFRGYDVGRDNES